MSSLWRRAPPHRSPFGGPAPIVLGCVVMLATAALRAETTGETAAPAPAGAPAALTPAGAPAALTPAAESPDAHERVEPEAAPRVLWRFGSASPVSGAPAVGPSGLVYVTSVEGFVHALDAEGGLRWSYGLSGIPLGSPLVDASNQVYVATTAPRLYALRADGHLTWMLRLRTRLAEPPIWASPSSITYYGRDQSLYDVPTWGAAPRGRHLGQVASGPLGSLGAGLVALGTAAQAQVYRGATLVARLPLDGVPSQPLLGGAERWFAPTRAGVIAYDAATRARLWSSPGQHAALSADEKGLIVASGRELSWLSPETGQPRKTLPLPDDLSAPPVLTNAGVALVPLVGGDLLLVDGTTSRVARVRVAAAPVWSPVWSEQSQRVTAAAGGGVVTLDLSAWQRPGAAEEGSLPAAAEDDGA